MSCEQNLKAYEAAIERFWELMENYDFQCLIGMHFLDAQEQWKEKHFGFSEDPYNNAFEWLWNWDCEAMHHDIEACVKDYIEDYSFVGINEEGL